MVRFYKGIDGLKTGYTDNAKYCLTATMKKNNMRLLSIVMKEESKENRENDTISMMEYGFSQYGIDNILDKNTYKDKIIINNAKNREVNYYLNEDVNIISKKGSRDVKYKIDKELYDLKAPISKNSIIGKLTLTYDGEKYTYDLIVKDDIKKANIFNIIYFNFKDMISGIKLFNS